LVLGGGYFGSVDRLTFVESRRGKGLDDESGVVFVVIRVLFKSQIILSWRGGRCGSVDRCDVRGQRAGERWKTNQGDDDGRTANPFPTMARREKGITIETGPMPCSAPLTEGSLSRRGGRGGEARKLG
jgi:hypothetical protein